VPEYGPAKYCVAGLMKIIRKCAYIVIICFVIVFVTAAIAWMPFGAFKFMESANAPAWVQAVGSIMAILIAIWVPAYQHDKQQKAEENKRRAYMRVFIKRVDFDFGLLKDNQDKPALCKQITDTMSADLQEFLKTDIDDVRSEACLELLWAFQAMAWEVNFNTPQMENYPVVIQVIEESFERLKSITS
jgi:uncharacterized membrane protein